MPQQRNAENLAGYRISDDGSSVTLYLGMPDTEGPGAVLELTLPAPQLLGLFAAVGGIIDKLRMAQLMPREVTKPARPMQSWKVGSNSYAPGMIALLFDEGLTQETFLMTPALAALQMADAIEQEVLRGMSADQQRDMMAEVEKAAGRRPRIITRL